MIIQEIDLTLGEIVPGEIVSKITLGLITQDTIICSGIGQKELLWFWAVSEEHYSIIMALFERALIHDPNIKDQFGNSALMRVAASADNPVIVKVLLAIGASPNTKNAKGNTVLTVACQREEQELRYQIAEALFLGGADPHLPNDPDSRYPDAFALAEHNKDEFLLNLFTLNRPSFVVGQ